MTGRAGGDVQAGEEQDELRHRVFLVVRRNLLEVVPDIDPAGVTLDVAMSDLGCNSIDRAEVVTLSMEDLGVVVPVMEFRRVSDLRSLVSLLCEHA